MTNRQPSTQSGSGRFVLGIAILVAGLVLLLDTLGVDIPWGIVLPSGVVLVGLVLLLNPRGPATGWIVAGGVLTVAMLASSLGGWQLGERSADNVEQANFTVTEEVVRIVVSVDQGSVEVVATPGVTGIEVDRDLNFNVERPEIGHSIEGGVLEVESDCPGGLFGSLCWVDHVLRVPESIAVEIDTGSGSVRVAGISGDVEAVTGSGVITLTDLSGRISASSGSGGVSMEQVSGVADVSTGSGSIRGSALSSSRLSADTGSGSINVAFAAAPDLVDLETGSGSVGVDVPSGAYRLDLDTNSGSTRTSGVTDDASSTRVIVVRTGSGSIRVSGS